MSVVFHSMVGPFDETTFALFHDRGEGRWKLDWDTGPEWRVTDIVSDQVRVFKFLPGEAGEIRVSLGFGNSLDFEARAIPVFAAAITETEPLRTVSSATRQMTSICANPMCGSHSCPDPTKPDLRCPGGNKECYKSEAD